MTTPSEKQNKAEAIRKYMADNPNTKAQDVAKALGCNVAYVYLIRAQQGKVKKKPTRGQIVLRQEISNVDARIEMIKMENAELRKKIDSLHTVIHYLENRLHGSPI